MIVAHDLNKSLLHLPQDLAQDAQLSSRPLLKGLWNIVKYIISYNFGFSSYTYLKRFLGYLLTR